MGFDEFPSWRAAELDARGAQVVDVRERHEVVTGTLPGARHIPLEQLASRLHELDRDRPVALLCRSGNRSREAAELLVQRGFRRVVNLAGGIEGAKRRSA